MATEVFRVVLDYVVRDASALAGRTVNGTAPVKINGGASATLASDITVSVDAATTSTAGTMSAADKSKLDSITTIGVPETRTITGTAPVKINGTTSATLAGNITVSVDAATTSAAGTMSAADKTKLDGAASETRKITFTTGALYFSDPDWGDSTGDHDLTHNMEISAINASAVDAGLMSAADKSKLDGIADATTTAKGLVQLAGDLGGTAASPYVLSATTDREGKVQLAGDFGGTSTSPSVLKLRGATVPTSPLVSEIGYLFCVDGAGSYATMSPYNLDILTRTDCNTTVQQSRNVYTDGSGFRNVECTYWSVLQLATSTPQDITIYGSTWGAVGLLHSSTETACLFIEVETEHNSSAGPAVRQIFRGHLMANRSSSSDWVRTYDLTAVTSETDGASASITMTMALSGTQNGDITITVTDANAAAAQSPAMIKTRLLGGWRVA